MLLEQPLVFDIVIGDFGRESTIEFMRSMAIAERRLIRSLLEKPDLSFFDEYRRLMFVLLGDLAYFKKDLIAAYSDKGQLDRDILVGMSGNNVPDHVAQQIETGVIQQLCMGVAREHKHVRVVIPCNTLAPVGRSLSRLFADKTALAARIRAAVGRVVDDRTVEKAMACERLEVATIPGVVLDDVRSRYGSSAELLVLGTPATVMLYREELGFREDLAGYSVVELSTAEQEIVNDAIVASIDSDSSVVRQLRQRIESEVLASRTAASSTLVVIEACTDFDLGLGVNSRKTFVSRLVCDAYGLPMMSAATLA